MVGRRKKEDVVTSDETTKTSVESNSQPSPMVNKININELMEKARGRFSKQKKGSPKQLKTGNEIVLSTDPEDYISSPDVDKVWGPLTGLLGFAYGRIFQIAGKPDSGKSTFGMMVMRAAQMQNTIVVLWDAEGKFDSHRFRSKMGGRPQDIPVATSRSIIEGARQVIAYVKAIKEMDPTQKILIVWDSVGASLNSAEDEENDDHSKQPGVTAKEVGWAIRRFNQLMERSKDPDGRYTISILCINQVYANIGSVGFKQKGGSELEYLSSFILEMTRKGNLLRTRNKQRVKHGIKSIARVKKNHLHSGEDCIAELELVVSASGIELLNDVKSNNVDNLEEDEEE